MEQEKVTHALSDASLTQTDCDHTTEIDRVRMDERRRWMVKVTLVIRNEMRTHFGVSFSNGCGHFSDYSLSGLISDFSWWLDYPKGHRCLYRVPRESHAAVVSCDGCYLYTAGDDGSIREWSLITLIQHRNWSAHDGKVCCLAYHSGILASGGTDNCIRLWDCYNGEITAVKHTLEEHSHYVFSVDFNEVGNLIVSASGDSSIRVWSVHSGECLREWRGHMNYVLSACFCKGSTRIISGAWDKSIRVWEEPNQDALTHIEHSQIQFIERITLNCDSSRIACAFGTDGFAVFKWPEMSVIHADTSVDTDSVVFHPHNPDILAVMDSHTVSLFSMSTTQIIVSHIGHTFTVGCLCFSPNGHRLISVAGDHSTRIWDITDQLSLE